MTAFGDTRTAQKVPPTTSAWEATLTGRFLAALFAAYENECVRYVVLRNYTQYPRQFGKDVDLVVHPNDVQVSHQILRRLAPKFDLGWTARRKRSSHLTYTLVPLPVDGTERGILIDIRTDVVHQGLPYLPAELVLAGRRRLDIFCVPAPAVESLAILLHCILDARAIRPSYRDRLRELGTGERTQFVETASEVVGMRLAEKLAASVENDKVTAALALRGQLFRALARRNPQGVSRWLHARLGSVIDKGRGILRPHGKLVILVGPDGAGKTTLSSQIVERFAATHMKVSSVYLGAQKPLLPTRRWSQQLRRWLSPTSSNKRPIKDVNRKQRLRGLVHIMADKWLRYVVYVRPRLARGEAVVLDRYFYDLRTFAHPLVRTPWLERLIMWFIPVPAVAFSLEADPAVIAARKNELTVAETARQIDCYRGLTQWVRNFHSVPADGDLPRVVDWMTTQVFAVHTADRAPETI